MLLRRARPETKRRQTEHHQVLSSLAPILELDETLLFLITVMLKVLSGLLVLGHHEQAYLRPLLNL